MRRDQRIGALVRQVLELLEQRPGLSKYDIARSTMSREGDISGPAWRSRVSAAISKAEREGLVECQQICALGRPRVKTAVYLTPAGLEYMEFGDTVEHACPRVRLVVVEAAKEDWLSRMQLAERACADWPSMRSGNRRSALSNAVGFVNSAIEKGMLEARRNDVGRRPRTEVRITPKGERWIHRTSVASGNC